MPDPNKIICFLALLQVWPGCESSIEVCSAYPSDPVVTMEITIYPETWHSAISMQILVYGQKFASFNRKFECN